MVSWDRAAERLGSEEYKQRHRFKGPEAKRTSTKKPKGHAGWTQG
jgi:hypothetical protein